MPERMIQLKDLSFAYDGGDVIRGVSLKIAKGEIVGIIGPNGAGKSTLIKLMGGMLKPRTGSVLLNGAELAGIPALKRARQIALVPQETHIPFPFSALEVVLMGRAPWLKPFGFESKGDVARAREAMDRTDTARFERRPIDGLSGGEKQRVFLARALAQATPLLLLDEPTTFLDIRHQSDLHRILREMNRNDGTTVVSAMHDLNLASAFCARIVVIKDGRIVADGTPREVISPDIIRAAFDAEVHIGTDAHTGMPYCLPTGAGLKTL